MPNHCANSLTIRGPESELLRFKKYARTRTMAICRDCHGTGKYFGNTAPVRPCPRCKGKGKGRRIIELDLNKFIPMPRPLRYTSSPNRSADAALLRKKYTYDNWYDWSISNWGTKWGCYDTTVTEPVGGHMDYTFSTAWSPFSDNVLEAMMRKFPELEFRLAYAEQGCAFAGITILERDHREDYQFELKNGIPCREDGTPTTYNDDDYHHTSYPDLPEDCREELEELANHSG